MSQDTLPDRLDDRGIRLRPIRLRKSLYLLIPIELARLISVTKETPFLLTLKHNGDYYILEYKKQEGSHGEGEGGTSQTG